MILHSVQSQVSSLYRVHLLLYDSTQDTDKHSSSI